MLINIKDLKSLSIHAKGEIIAQILNEKLKGVLFELLDKNEFISNIFYQDGQISVYAEDAEVIEKEEK